MVDLAYLGIVGSEFICIQILCLCLVQYGTRGKCPSFCYKDFFVTSSNCMFILISILQLNTSFRLSWSSILQQAMHCWRLNRWVKRCWVWCVLNWVEVYLQVWLQEELYRLRHRVTYISIGLWCTFIWRQRHFCSEWQWPRWHCWCKLQTMDYQYKLSYCTCSPQVYRRSQWVMTSRGTPRQ